MVSRFWRQHELVRQGRREAEYAGIFGRPRTPHGELVLRQRRTVYWRMGHLVAPEDDDDADELVRVREERERRHLDLALDAVGARHEVAKVGRAALIQRDPP